MADELTKEVIVGCVTAIVSGIPAAVLVWWTYKRDQERLIVEKTRPDGMALERKRPLSKRALSQEDVPVFGIVIRNRSLFSVHVSAVGFEIDGKVIRAGHPLFPMKMKRNPDAQSNYLYIPDDSADPFEVPSQASIQVSINREDRNIFAAAIYSAATERGVSVESILDGMIAMVATETGKLFTSMPVRKRIYRWFLRTKNEMDGKTDSETEL
jgi:hypothetical protein